MLLRDFLTAADSSEPLELRCRAILPVFSLLFFLSFLSFCLCFLDCLLSWRQQAQANIAAACPNFRRYLRLENPSCGYLTRAEPLPTLRVPRCKLWEAAVEPNTAEGRFFSTASGPSLRPLRLTTPPAIVSARPSSGLAVLTVSPRGSSRDGRWWALPIS